MQWLFPQAYQIDSYADVDRSLFRQIGQTSINIEHSTARSDQRRALSRPLEISINIMFGEYV